jgi:hypothetical protein
MKTVTLTELRKNIFQLVDEVVATGEPLVIERKGKRLTLKGETASKDETRAEADERWRAFWAQPPRPGWEKWDVTVEEFNAASRASWHWSGDDEPNQ